MTDPIYDIIGIGVGPFNLGLAALAQPIESLQTLFLEQTNAFNWHPGLLLDDVTLQVPFLADLVTLADPTHQFSFLNYLQQQQRLYKFYFYENFQIPRQEYNHYCQWVCQQLPQVKFGYRVTQVTRIIADQQALFKVTAWHQAKQQHLDYYTHHLALGIGKTPFIPAKLQPVKSDYIQHSAHFLTLQKHLTNEQQICVVGSGQSAAEVVLALLNQYHSQPRNITWLTRSPGFFPMEYSKLGLEHFSADYMQYFNQLAKTTREQLIPQQDLLYKGISAKTIADIYHRLYQLTIAGASAPLTLLAHTELSAIHPASSQQPQRFNLTVQQWQTQQTGTLAADAVILATGYQARPAAFLQPLANDLLEDSRQSYRLNADFSIQTRQPWANKIFIQNDSLYSHGVGSPDLGLGCHRNSVILNSVLQQAYYPVHLNSVFQTFGLPASYQEHDHDLIRG